MFRTVIMTVTDSQNVDLLDLSRSGARLGGADLPAPGQEVLLLIGRLEAFAYVVWQAEEQCGVRFDIELSDSAYASLESECRRTVRIGGPAAEDWLYGTAR